MDLIQKLEALQRAAQPIRNQDDQMKTVDALEKTLANMGVSLQPTFQISLASRAVSSANVNQLA